jgi:hypothetical protein
MRASRTYGSVRGDRGNPVPYRDSISHLVQRPSLIAVRSVNGKAESAIGLDQGPRFRIYGILSQSPCWTARSSPIAPKGAAKRRA